MTAEITHFPKRCHLHKLPMVWEELRELSSGWKCPKCTLTCPTHGDPMRSGVGALYPVGVLYCRRCRISQINKEARKKRDEIAEALRFHWHEMEDPGSAPGVTHIWRIPT